MLPEPELVAEVDQLCRNGRLHPYARKKSQSRQRYGQYRRQRRDVVQVASTSSAKALLIRDHTAPDDPASIFATVQQNLTTSCVDPKPAISRGARLPVPALQTATLSSLSATKRQTTETGGTPGDECCVEAPDGRQYAAARCRRSRIADRHQRRQTTAAAVDTAHYPPAPDAARCAGRVANHVLVSRQRTLRRRRTEVG